MAEREVTFSSVRGRQMREVLEMVKKRQGQTSAEYALDAWMCEIGLGVLDRPAIARRLPDLQKLGLVKQGKKRKCLDTGRMCVTWWLV